MPKSKKNHSSNKSDGFSIYNWFLLCTNIISKIGVPGFIIICFVTFIYVWASPEQKREIIDTWVLFKNNNNSQEFTYTVVIFSIVIYFLEYFAFRRISKLDKEEIKRLSEFKRLYQEQQIGNKLPASEQRD